MEPATHLEVLSTKVGEFLGTARGAMAARVPSCPEWTVADLVVHMGVVWGWAADIVETRVRADGGTAPEGREGAALLSWAQGQAERLVDALGSADPDADCWTFGQPRSIRFWFRRQALETTLHAWDAQGALGTPAHIGPDVAADGVDEHLSVMVPRALRLRPDAWTGQTVHLHRTDGDGEWVVRLGPGNEVLVEYGHSKADAALRGTAEALWLWCTNRATADEVGVERFGDDGIVARWATEMTF